jgi:carboxymethylenebutenolidase
MTIKTLKHPDGDRPQDYHLSRRAIPAAFFAGYAAAAVSADAAPIVTDEQGLKIDTVMLPTKGQSIRGYIARPADSARHPVVIVVNEIFGIHEHIKDICRRFAKLGYVAIAPGFFDRAGDPAPLSDMSKIRPIVNATPDKQVLDDIGSTLTYLKAQKYADSNHIGIIGFCWGGGVVWLACETYPQIKAGVAWYGRLAPAANAAPNPDQLWPAQKAKELHAPVLGLYAGKDPLTQMVPEMRKQLAANNDYRSQIVIYPDASHGFFADYRASYNEADAKDGWHRLLVHFTTHGVSTPKAVAAAKA